MNASKFFLISSILSLSFLVSTFAFAMDSVTVATVNIVNAKIVSQDKNVFNISFDLTNRERAQTGVKYSVRLTSLNSKYLIDEKVYDESVALAENSKVSKNIIYKAPEQINGTYNLYLVSNNESNFPFGVASLGKVVLQSSVKGFEIVNDSCYLKVEGDKTNTHYSLDQSVDISKEEMLRLTCNTINHSSNALSLIPTFKTEYTFAPGKVAEETGGDLMPISFKANKSENFSILLPKGAIPQFYNLNISLSNGSVTSNTISMHYIIRGVSAVIQNLSLDKDYYEAGDNGELALLWSASNGNFARSDIKNATPPTVNLALHIQNDSGRECINPVSQTLKRDLNSPQTKIPFTIKTTCKNPSISAVITDEAGNTLDQKNFAFKSVSDKNLKPINKTRATLIIVLLLVIVGLGIYFGKKKSTKATI